MTFSEWYTRTVLNLDIKDDSCGERRVKESLLKRVLNRKHPGIVKGPIEYCSHRYCRYYADITKAARLHTHPCIQFRSSKAFRSTQTYKGKLFLPRSHQSKKKNVPPKRKICVCLQLHFHDKHALINFTPNVSHENMHLYSLNRLWNDFRTVVPEFIKFMLHFKRIHDFSSGPLWFEIHN